MSDALTDSTIAELRNKMMSVRPDMDATIKTRKEHIETMDARLTALLLSGERADWENYRKAVLKVAAVAINGLVDMHVDELSEQAGIGAKVGEIVGEGK